MTCEQFIAITKLSINTDEVVITDGGGSVLVEANDIYDDERGKTNFQTWVIHPDGHHIVSFTPA